MYENALNGFLYPAQHRHHHETVPVPRNSPLGMGGLGRSILVMSPHRPEAGWTQVGSNFPLEKGLWDWGTKSQAGTEGRAKLTSQDDNLLAGVFAQEVLDEVVGHREECGSCKDGTERT